MSDEKKEAAEVRKVSIREDILETEGYKIKTGEEIEIIIIPKNAGVSE